MHVDQLLNLAARRRARLALGLLTASSWLATTQAPAIDSSQLADASPAPASVLAAPGMLPGPAELRKDPPTEFRIPAPLHPWLRFRPGAWRRYTITTESFDDAGKATSQSTTTQDEVLAKVDVRRFGLRRRATVRTLGRSLEGQWIEAAYWAELDGPGEIVACERLPNETVILSCRPVACSVWRIEYDLEGRRLSDRVWFSAEQFPYVLKRQRTTASSSGAASDEVETVEAFADGLPHRVAGKTLRCAYVRTVRQGPKGRTVEASLVSAEAPGGKVAAWSTDWDANNRRISSTVMSTVEYGVAAPEDDAEEESPNRRALRRQQRRER